MSKEWLEYWIREIEHESRRRQMVMRVHERIVFRLILMPCCGHLHCWVNTRNPNFCPECGHHFRYGEIAQAVRLRDDKATLTYDKEAKI